jgi:sulfate permease, SulP family
MAGLLPVNRSQITADVLAGITLAAVSIPVALGYAKIAGMPVVTGLYTLLLPMAVFAVLGSSRHLVVGADSATAAILGAALAGHAVAGSPQYVRLAGLAALLAGGLLLLARLARLGFLADFLSRTVLVGFLTGVGIQVAAGQLPEMLGVTVTSKNTLVRLLDIVRALPQTHPADLAVSAGVIAIVLAAKASPRKIPGLLIAVVAAIIVSRAADLAGHGVAVLGTIPRGLPHLGLPALGWHDATALMGTALSLFVVILAQSAATSRAYAGKYEEAFSEDTDLVGLGAANVAAALSGTFVVNGSPTQTQVADSAGGRSQLASLTTSAVVLIVLLLLTGPLASLPIAALAAVVFVIAIGLIDVRGLRRILACRRPEFTIALLTTAAVVTFGIEQGIALAVVASIIEHLRHTSRPVSSLLVKSPAGHWRQVPVRPGARTVEGLAVYRFGAGLYYANAVHLVNDITAIAAQGSPLQWLVLDAAAIGDIDYTAATVLTRAIEHLHKRGIHVAFSSVLDPVREQLDRYGISATLGPAAYYDTPGEALEAFYAAKGGGHVSKGRGLEVSGNDVVDEAGFTGSERRPVAGELEDGDGGSGEADRGAGAVGGPVVFRGRGQVAGQVGQARVVRDEQRGPVPAGEFLSQVEQGLRAGRVRAGLDVDGRRPAQFRGHQVPGLPGPAGGRAHHDVGLIAVLVQPAADPGRVPAPALGQRTIPVRHVRPVRLGVPQQDQLPRRVAGHVLSLPGPRRVPEAGLER